jgi:hypothetical protein
MLMNRLFLGSLFLLLATLPAPARADEPTAGPWQLIKQADGVVVDRRAVSGSNLKEFRGRGVVTASLPAILAVFSDVARATEWMDSCSGSRTVADVSDREKLVYNRTHAPWPVSDRDAVLDNRVTFDEAEKAVRLEFWSVADERAPPVPGVVRMPFLRGHWTLWPASDGKTTRVEYQVHANPGGRLPDWLVNYVSRDLPFRTITGLRAQLRRRSYPEVERVIQAKLPPFLAAPAIAQKPSL